MSTTGVGDGIAIPHAKAKAFEKAMIIYAKSNEGIEWESFDSMPAKHIFMICAPANGADEHLKDRSRCTGCDRRYAHCPVHGPFNQKITYTCPQ